LPLRAGKTLRDNLTMLGAHVLPLREQFRVLYSLALRRGAAAANALADRFSIARLPFAKSTGGRYERPATYVRWAWAAWVLYVSPGITCRPQPILGAGLQAWHSAFLHSRRRAGCD
jgi:hypothetical protein